MRIDDTDVLGDPSRGSLDAPGVLERGQILVAQEGLGVRDLDGEARLGYTREPQRGEVVVFVLATQGNKVYPVDARPDLPTDGYVKRVVGLPGDVIELRDAALYINGERQTGIDSAHDFPIGSGVKAAVLPEELGEVRYQVLDHPRRTSRFGPTSVEPGRYYLVGDHRDLSNDSRYFGTVPETDIIGLARMVYFSWDSEESDRAIYQRPRWSRIGRLLR